MLPDVIITGGCRTNLANGRLRGSLRARRMVPVGALDRSFGRVGHCWRPGGARACISVSIASAASARARSYSTKRSSPSICAAGRPTTPHHVTGSGP